MLNGNAGEQPVGQVVPDPTNLYIIFVLYVSQLCMLKVQPGWHQTLDFSSRQSQHHASLLLGVDV